MRVINQPCSGGWADLSLVLGSVGRAPPLPPRGSGRSSSGSAGAGRSQEVRSVCGDKTPPPRGPQLQCLWVWAEQSGEWITPKLSLLTVWTDRLRCLNKHSIRVFFCKASLIFSLLTWDVQCKGKHITLWCPWQCEYNQTASWAQVEKGLLM